MPRSLARNHDSKRAAIRHAAARVFARDGYGGASMAAVAVEAGVSKPALYHYHGGKAALLFDVLDAHLSALRDRICGLRFDTDDPRAQLKAIVTELLLAYDGADAEHAVQMTALDALPPEQQEALRAHQRALVAFLRARVSAMAPHLDRARLGAATMSVFAMANWHHRWDGRADADARRAYAAMVADIMAGGLPATEET